MLLPVQTPHSYFMCVSVNFCCCCCFTLCFYFDFGILWVDVKLNEFNDTRLRISYLCILCKITPLLIAYTHVQTKDWERLRNKLKPFSVSENCKNRICSNNVNYNVFFFLFWCIFSLFSSFFTERCLSNNSYNHLHYMKADIAGSAIEAPIYLFIVSLIFAHEIRFCFLYIMIMKAIK